MYEWNRRSRPHQNTGTIWRNPAQRKMAEQSDAPAPPLGTLIKELRVNDLNETSKSYEETAVISGCSVVSSYSWLSAREPTILVPGRPPRWTPLSNPVRLPEDDGEYFRDKNAARYPKHPMEPAIIASLKTSPELCRERTVDVVACGSSLGNLLRFVRGQDKSFRILAEMVEGTVFFVRRENSPTALIPEVRGFGHTFPEHYTTWDRDVKGSASHERVLRYNFGGLSFLVRFGADGYIEKPSLAAKKSSTPSSTAEKTPSSLSELVSSLGHTQITPDFSTSSTGLKIQSGGSIVDQSCIFDLKTRSFRKKQEDTIGEELPRCWVAQIPNFIIAYHEWGVFKDIQVQDIRSKVNQWEKAHNHDLSRLAALVHRITALLRSGSRSKIELIHDGNGTLQVREALPDTTDALSPAVRAMWNQKQDVEKDPEKGGDDGILEWKDELDGDFTSCSGSCGYCGRCGST